MEKNKRENKSNVLYFLGRILSCEVKTDSFKVYHEEESIFTKISYCSYFLYYLFKMKQLIPFEKLKATAKKDAKANGLLSNAEKNAKTIISSFFWKEYNKDEYKIKYIG